MAILGLLLSIGLALIHIFAGTISRRIITPVKGLSLTHWHSFAGGVATTYIFLEVFPALAAAQYTVEQEEAIYVSTVQHFIYVLALLGLLLFYGLEGLAMRDRRANRRCQGCDRTSTAIFWIHILAFAVNTAILGYLFHEQTAHGLISCLLLFGALALHFFVMDDALREHHQRAYDRIGRWILGAAILIGWCLGQVIILHAVALAGVWAFVAGGIILNVLKEEIPKQQESCFWIFCTGSGLYGILVLSHYAQI
jgi:hypothetical protein